ncbi:TerB family tellurite resistance protein [Prochlorothrix hollandica]|uniref:Co-chaperone DjlA N-terminal domain-containing protein n=1 Tax=Prochlorothrix hollandica PCC 9006 = CALU 1027 TaxID=317619 RepID=A0A0M2PVB7_PROHO|nr:TerB family tellurite resistance protein [Prochlorothrix hollandica]KKJ00090.1 hypothetical protein PROH_10115 [Prochlorothrix hollandica PCC 9006 = CALU 1027]
MGQKEQSLTDKIQAQLSEQMMGLFESVMQERKVVHRSNPSLAQQSADSIIGSYSNGNAVISGTVGLIPGPMGMLAVLPEILKIMHNQISMVYDIGASYGKETVITKEVLLGVVIGATGTGAASLLVMKGSTILVKRATLSTFQRVIAQLSGRVTQQALKSAIGKWLPGVGAVAIAAWSYYMTRQIGKQAKEIFEKEISWEGNTTPSDDLEDNTTPSDNVLEDLDLSSSSGESENIEFLRVKAIINLIRADGVIEEEERIFFKNMLQNASLSKDEISQIRESLQSKSKLPVDFKVLAKHPDEVVSLMVDLVSVAKRDGNFHITEKMYIKQVGQALNLDAADVEEMMSVVV